MNVLKSDLEDAMLAGAAMGVARLDTGEILLATPLLEEMFGYKMRGKLATMKVNDLVPNELQEAHTLHMEDFRKMPTMRIMGVGRRLRGKKHDGSTFPVAVSLSPVILSGVECAAFNVMDMTGWVYGD